MKIVNGKIDRTVEWCSSVWIKSIFSQWLKVYFVTPVNEGNKQTRNRNDTTIYGCIKMSLPNRSRSSTPSKESKKPPTVPSPPVGFSAKLFKKCKSATFQIDGATYTIGEW